MARLKPDGSAWAVARRSLVLVLATWLYGEPFGLAETLTFALIWLALLLYTAEIWRTRVV